MQRFRGPFVRMPKCGEVTLTSSEALIVVGEDGKIVIAADKGEPGYDERPATRLGPGQVLCPGFVDAHAHAPQHSFIGNGLDLPLMDWLETYTFPEESKFSDVTYAEDVYEKAVRRHLNHGATTVSYFGTIHVEGTLKLAEVCQRLGQRAHVGKVSMDKNSPVNYCEETEKGAADAELFVATVLKRGGLVTPAIMPRFGPSCSKELLDNLGKVAKKYDVPVHTHLSENSQECAIVAEAFPEASCYADVYARSDLMTRAYFAHCCYCDATERALLKKMNAGVVTCPTSNFIVGRALCDVRQFLDDGVTVAVGTDVAGGYSPSMLVTLRAVVIASNILASQLQDLRKALSWREALYLATKGGATCLGLVKTGDLNVGSCFDALIIDLLKPGSYDVFPHERNDLNRLFEKFIWNGDDRQLLHVFVNGKRVAGSASSRRHLLLSILSVAAAGAFIVVAAASRGSFFRR